jgi:hypothetical protein
MPSRVIGREVCLRIRGLSKLSKDLGPKRCLNTWKNEEPKETRESMKVEEGGVHHNIYDGRCKKQWVKILKIIWTSLILRRRLTCWTSFSLQDIFNEGWCEWWSAQWNPQDVSFFSWGVKLRWGDEVKWQVKGGPCYTFMKLNMSTCTRNFDDVH